MSFTILLGNCNFKAFLYSLSKLSLKSYCLFIIILWRTVSLYTIDLKVDWGWWEDPLKQHLLRAVGFMWSLCLENVFRQKIIKVSFECYNATSNACNLGAHAYLITIVIDKDLMRFVDVFFSTVSVCTFRASLAIVEDEEQNLNLGLQFSGMSWKKFFTSLLFKLNEVHKRYVISPTIFFGSRNTTTLLNCHRKTAN